LSLALTYMVSVVDLRFESRALTDQEGQPDRYETEDHSRYEQDVRGATIRRSTRQVLVQCVKPGHADSAARGVSKPLALLELLTSGMPEAH
jgi:hypothetical protein